MHRNSWRALFAALFAATGAFALDPGRALTQARLSVWNSDSGLPQNTIEAIVQSPIARDRPVGLSAHPRILGA